MQFNKIVYQSDEISQWHFFHSCQHIQKWYMNVEVFIDFFSLSYFAIWLDYDYTKQRQTVRLLCFSIDGATPRSVRYSSTTYVKLWRWVVSVGNRNIQFDQSNANVLFTTFRFTYLFGVNFEIVLHFITQI